MEDEKLFEVLALMVATSSVHSVGKKAKPPIRCVLILTSALWKVVSSEYRDTCGEMKKSKQGMEGGGLVQAGPTELSITVSPGQGGEGRPGRNRWPGWEGGHARREMSSVKLRVEKLKPL